MAGSDKIQAVVKVVRKGGTHNAAEIRRQAEYVSRDGNVPMERSERYHGAAVDPDTLRQLAQSWVAQTGIVNADGRSSRDLTTHMVVSFPQGTDPERARAAAREWAHETFGGQNGQDAYDYLTAMHVETGNPHMHLIINRRGLNRGDWLKIANRHEYYNYQNMRRTMVECAARHGIEMEATTREERGLDASNINDAEYRRRQRGEEARPSGAFSSGFADPFAERRDRRRGRDPDDNNDGEMPPRQRQRQLRDPALPGPSNALYATGDPALDAALLRDGGVAREDAGAELPDARNNPAGQGADGRANALDDQAQAAGGGDAEMVNEPDAADLPPDGNNPATDAQAPRRRKRQADVEPRHMELRSDKRARLAEGMEQRSRAGDAGAAMDEAEPAGDGNTDAAQAPAPRQRRQNAERHHMETRSARRARLEGMRLRSGRNLGTGGQDRPAQDRDPRRETR